MTMILGLAARGCAILVGDRLVSKASRRDGRYLGDYDDTSNKQIILVGKDGWALIGYSGAAYIDGLPTDFWLTEAIIGEPLPRQRFILNNERRPAIKLTTALWRIRERIGATPGAHGLQIIVVGYRNYGRGTSLPFLWRWSGLRTTDWVYRHRDRPNRLRISWVGAHLRQEALEAKFGPYVTPTHIHLNAKDCVDLLSSIIAETADTDDTVGRDQMHIWGQPWFGIRFNFVSSEADRPTIRAHLRGLDGALHFSPFIVGPNFVAPPGVTNMGAATITLNGVSIQEVLATNGQKPTRGLGITGADRKPPL